MEKPEPRFDAKAFRMGTDLVDLDERQFFDRYGVTKGHMRTTVDKLHELILAVEANPRNIEKAEELVRTMSHIEKVRRRA